ncbi:cytidine deaminase [Martelella sp. HB161492]|uniref:cytidine deaminase n=1 Tax=Martelella sp. HB161492 TaxID=2720726 RepID=UPI001591A2F5|nr:cytidine deaminase [Martelella sp. HB161492]
MNATKTLFEAAKAASGKAYAPYSKFSVGAAILGDDGILYAGANIENLAFPEGLCAEGVAIGHMIMGGARKIAAIAVYAPKLALCPPCGGCRQKIAEFADAETRIYLCDDGGVAKEMTIAELLPHVFETGAIG